MPYKPSRPCLYAGCAKTVISGYCQSHEHFYTPPQRAIDTRPSAAARGYDKNWQTIRIETLRNAGIPKELWHLYDIHHEPDYNPAIEKKHTAYKLTPMLKSDHSRLTAQQKGGGFNLYNARLETVHARKELAHAKGKAR